MIWRQNDWTSAPAIVGYSARGTHEAEPTSGGWSMEKLRFVGLDVHSKSITIAVVDWGRQPAKVLSTVPNEANKVVKQLAKLGKPGELRICYEAGPTGFGLCRTLREKGYACMVVAPSLVPEKSGDRVKTDRRDAARLAHFLRSGDLTEVHVPDAGSEAVRDLSRAREDAKENERRARQQLGTFLMRHGHYYEGKRWTEKHVRWIESLRLEHEAQMEVRNDYVKAVRDASERVKTLTKKIETTVEKWQAKPVVQALRALRGVDLVTAVVLVAEIGSFMRFATAREFMAYLGLVPSESSSGEKKKRGRITRCGNGHVRRVLVESAWAYRHRAKMSREIRKRNEGLPESIKRHAWKGQERLHGKYVRLIDRNMPSQKAIVAVARELAGFVWAIGREAQAPRVAESR